MPSSHTLLIAGISATYLASMVGLVVYSCWPSKPRSEDEDPPDAGEDEQPALLAA